MIDFEKRTTEYMIKKQEKIEVIKVKLESNNTFRPSILKKRRSFD
jgi:hypothetical protein